MVFTEDVEIKETPKETPKQVEKESPKKKDKQDIVVGDIDIETVHYLRQFYQKVSKVGKDDLIFYTERKTMFGNKILATDKIIEIGIINAGNFASFISITYKLIKETEIENVAMRYVSVGVDRRPLVVERKYMFEDEYAEQRRRVMEEIL